MNKRILAIDDDNNFLEFLKKYLDDTGYEVTVISDSNNATEQLKENDFDCILLDVRIPGINGLELLDLSLKSNPTTPVIMVSGQSNIKIAVEALKLGAFDFVEKPIDVNKLHATIKNAVEKKSLSIEKENLFSELKESYMMVGESSETKEIISQINAISDTPAKVLIQGETGTGKELVAWAIHHNSSRKSKPYIKINCAAIPSELLESELFGYKKGAFTGANETKVGKFIAADGGTLFLDEIGDMDLNLQSKILRVLEENEVDILGENKPKKINVRIIAATNQNIERKIDEGSFRKDLFFRLNVANIFIPPLRERKADILPLANHFLAKFKDNYNKQITLITRNAEQILLNYSWPGNVRELRNLMEKVVLYSSSNKVDYLTIRKILQNNNNISNNISYDQINFNSARKIFEKEFIISHLEKNDWNISKTAEIIGLDRSNLFKKMKSLGIEKTES